ncbi:unnamed protein product [Agarophyton chilense]
MQFARQSLEGATRNYDTSGAFATFIDGLSRRLPRSRPLNAMLKKGTPSEFEALTDDKYEQFQTLKYKLLNPPTLVLPKPNRPFVLGTDASDAQVGCALLQEQESPKDYRPIGYWTRTLTSAQRNYSTTEKECLAIVWSVLTLRPYLEGTRFTIGTDHDSLRWLLNMTDASSRLARWRLKLSECDYEITYGPGINHQAADALSQVITEGTDDTQLDDLIPTPFKDDGPQNYTESDDLMVPPNSAPPQVNAIDPEEEVLLLITIEELLQAQVEDEYCKETAKLVGAPGCLYDYDRFGLLCRRSPLDDALQRVIPTSLRARFLYLAHFPRFAGHLGDQRMYQTLRKFFHWPQMAQDLWKTARNYASCAQIQGYRANHQAKLKLFPAACLPNLPALYPLGKTTATDVATAFLSHWVYPYDMPLYLLTDNGSQFVSKFFSHVCDTLGIKHATTTAYHPQTNGQAESFNYTLLDRLAHYVSEHQLDWDDYVAPLVYVYNTQVQASTGTTPSDLTLTRAPPPIAVDLQESIIFQEITEGMNPTQAKRYSRRCIDRIIQSAKTVLTKAQRHYKINFDKAVWNTLTFGKGDLVYLDRPPKESEELEDTTRKLLPRSTGPYKVLKANEHTIT